MKKVRDRDWVPNYTTVDIRDKPSPCAFCGKVVDMATSLERGLDNVPYPGCFTICGYCVELNVFNDDLTLRKPTMEELIDLQLSDYWPRLQRVMLSIKAEPIFGKKDPEPWKRKCH